jgi:electron transfer flavoprotein alpha subunit
MKSLIIGEVSNGTLSSGTLEIITKAQENNLDFKLVVIGTENNPKIGSDNFQVIYLELSPDELSFFSS